MTGQTDQLSMQTPVEKFTVEVAYNGVTKSIEVHLQETVEKLLNRAMDLFGIQNQRHLMALFRTDGSEVTPDTLPSPRQVSLPVPS